MNCIVVYLDPRGGIIRTSWINGAPSWTIHCLSFSQVVYVTTSWSSKLVEKIYMWKAKRINFELQSYLLHDVTRVCTFYYELYHVL
mgnify:CR=1 FL=1